MNILNKIIIVLVFSASGLVFSADNFEMEKGQLVYVPAYSNIYFGDKNTPILLTVTLIVRNTDMKNKIRIRKVDYFDTAGRILTRFVSSDIYLRPLESTEYVVPYKSKAGGSGAGFIVEWDAADRINTPIIETIMTGNQGLSFTARGKAIKE